MTTPVTEHLDARLEELASGGAPTAADATHLAGCDVCRARLALAVRLERVLMEWPAVAPSPMFTSRVLAAARQDAWRAERVVDWSFNAAIAAGAAMVLAGVLVLVWMLGSAASHVEMSRLIVAATESLALQVRGQAMVVGTATLLLSTGLGAWWWAEVRWRW